MAPSMRDGSEASYILKRWVESAARPEACLEVILLLFSANSKPGIWYDPDITQIVGFYYLAPLSQDSKNPHPLIGYLEGEIFFICPCVF